MSLRSEIWTLNRVYWDIPWFDMLGCSIGYVEKKRNLLSSIVGLIAILKPLSRHTTVRTLGWGIEPTHVGQY